MQKPPVYPRAALTHNGTGRLRIRCDLGLMSYRLPGC